MTIADKVVSVLGEVAVERARQDAKWGQQDHPDGTGPARNITVPEASFDWRLETSPYYRAHVLADWFRKVCQANTPDRDNWCDILLEEVFEAMAEAEPQRLRTELIQVAAVATQWVEAIDRRSS